MKEKNMKAKLRRKIKQNGIEKLFFGFLKIHGVYNEFLANYKEQGYWKSNDSRLEHTLKDSPQEAINFSFCWSETPQGHNFWDSLSDNWHECFLNLNHIMKSNENQIYEQLYEKNLKLFTAFLKLNNAYERYFINLRRSIRKERFDGAVTLYPSTIIDRTLIWDETNEGWSFWRSLHIKCQEFFEKIILRENP